MEIFGIVLSIPVGFVACTLYCLLLVKVIARFGQLSRWLRFASHIVLALFSVEVVLLITLGAVRSRGVFGPGFYAAHICFFFLGPPALANSLVLRPGDGFFTKWYVATVLCTVFAFLLVLLQYGVSEALYGIDGDNGPYSEQSSTVKTC